MSSGNLIVIGDADGWVNVYDEQFEILLGWGNVICLLCSLTLMLCLGVSPGVTRKIHCVAIHQQGALRGDIHIRISKFSKLIFRHRGPYLGCGGLRRRQN